MSSSRDHLSSTPLRLSFYSLPAHLPVNPGMATPPLRPPVSIPYKWEEAPGRPKNESGIGPRKSGPISVLGEVTQRLKLPPRLVPPTADDAKISKRTFSSAGAVLDGQSSALGYCYSFSFAESRITKKERVAWPWSKASSVRKMSLDVQESFKADRFVSSGSSYCYSYGTSDASSFSFSQRYGDHDFGSINMDNNKKNVGISRLKRNMSHVTTSRLWANIYNNLKQVVSWRREKINI